MHEQESDEGECAQEVKSESDDFAVLCPPCPPWSPLANRENRQLPNEHKEFPACFGAEGSCISVMLKRLPKSAVLEEVIQSSTIPDDTDRTGLQRIIDALKNKRVNGRRYYTGIAYVILNTKAWGLPCARER